MNYVEFLLAFAAFLVAVFAVVGGGAWLVQATVRRRRTRALAEIISLNGFGRGVAPQPSTNHG